MNVRYDKDRQKKWIFSPKQLAMMLWWQNPRFKRLDGVVAYGAVRSGKTVGMANGFVLWAMTNFDKNTFAICGKTIGSTTRNVITPLKDTLPDFGFEITEHKQEHFMEVASKEGKVNRFYIFGGKDESSQNLIQGITLAGIYFDEVTLQPESFVQQGMARCSVSGSKMWFCCNPEAPRHWFKLKIVDEYQRLRFLVMHFTMMDNASLDPRIIERYERTYVGTFYKRYILGEWAVSEGIVYPMFDENKNSTKMTKQDLFTTDVLGHLKFDTNRFSFPTVTMDYGTSNPTAMYLIVWDKQNRNFLVLDEFYFDGHGDTQIDDLQKYDALEMLVGDVPVRDVVIDPSAKSFITLVKNRHRFNPIAARNEVLEGIALTQVTLSLAKLRFNIELCPFVIGEFGLYLWDPKAMEKGLDAPLKINDHGMDAIRYFVQTVARRRASYFGISTVRSVDRQKVREQEREELE